MARAETGQKPRVTAAHAEPRAAKKAKKSRNRAPPLALHELKELRALTIPQFCKLYSLSIWTYYRIAREGTGPEIMKVNHKTLIAADDAKAWEKTRKDAAKAQRHAREAASAEA